MLLDLGAAFLEDGQKTFYIGTAAFASPEQKKGEGGVDARSDLYSLGAAMYYLLTGRYWEGSKYWQALNLHAPLQDSLYGDSSKFCTSESSTPGLPFLKFCPFHQKFLEASSLKNTPSHNKQSLPPQKYPAPLQSQDVKGASSNFSPYLSAASWYQILS